MGANIDAFSAGSGMGIRGDNTFNYQATSVGTKSLYKAASASLRSYCLGDKAQVDFFNQPSDTTPEDPNGSSGTPSKP